MNGAARRDFGAAIGGIDHLHTLPAPALLY